MVAADDSRREFSLQTRASNLREMRAEPLDVLVVGGGIVGAWTALTAARRGHRVGLVEKGDFASGTSGKTSRLIHGGLRYLRQLRIGLVRQAARERDTLLKIAPTLVKPLTFVIPVYRQHGPGAVRLRLGLWLYDLLSREGTLPRHRWLDREAAVALEPSIARDDLRAAAVYSDAMADDARLVLAVIRAAHDSSALVANYARVTALVRDQGKVRGAHVLDEETNQEATVRARVVVNATGVWSSDWQSGPTRLVLRPTKGIHVLVPRGKIGNRHAIVLWGSDGRLMFAIPWARFTLLGTTDTDFRGDREQVVANRGDVEYVLAAANRAIPSARLTPDDAVGVYAGLRPLVDTGEGKESDISRKHEIAEDPDGLVTVVGGKLTTARAIAEEVLDRVARRLPSSPNAAGRNLREVFLEDPGRLSSEEDVIREIPRIVNQEMVVHLDDVLVRRTPLFYESADQGASLAPRVAEALGVALRWDFERRASELSRYREIARAHREWREDPIAEREPEWSLVTK